MVTLVTRFVALPVGKRTAERDVEGRRDACSSIDQDLFMQHNVAIFLDKLRQARGLPVKGDPSPKMWR